MHYPLRGEQGCSRRKFVAAETDRFHIHSSHDKRRRVEAQRFVDDRVEIREILEVGDFRGTSAENGLEFLVQASLGFGIFTEQIPGPGERESGGLVAGNKEGHGLVAYL